MLQRIRGGSSGAVTAQRGTEDRQTLQGLGEGALAPERRWGTWAGAIWHINKGSPVWKDWAFSLVE